MSYPFFRRGLPDAGPSSRAEEIPTLDRRLVDDPGEYIPHADLSHAVNVALLLGMPLLVTGEPGTGKTQLASAVAHELQCGLHKFETKSTSAARDLFYTFDAISAFKAKEATDQRVFVRYQALGRAILDAFPRDNPVVDALLPPEAKSDYRHDGPRRSVVLIDEIDKAPRDFPNDLLNEIDRLYFRVPELGNIGSPGAEPGDDGVAPNYRPIIVLTSNSEKGLPDPFLRRCIYFDIPFPDEEQMEDIVAARLKGLTGSPMLRDAVDLFYSLRRERQLTGMRKEPSTAELINWLQMLRARTGPETRLTDEAGRTLVRETLSTLVKNTEDRRDAQAFVKDSWKGPASKQS